jgi:hypothetical protein
MQRDRLHGLLLAGVLLLAWRGAAVAGDGALCQAATSAAEHSTGVPDQLLGAISRVESGRADPETGAVRAWPWTINAQGVGHYYESKADALAAARAFQAAGIRSIDVGCTQINLMFHPDGFSSLEQAFDPGANAAYAARFLTDLFHQTGSWPHAAAAYHSQTPNLGSDYQRKVLDVWAEPLDEVASSHRRTAQPKPVAIASVPVPGPMGGGGGGGASPFGARPLGGYGHVIRTGPLTVPGAAGTGFAAGSLAAYRARPVALASLPIRAGPPS